MFYLELITYCEVCDRDRMHEGNVGSSDNVFRGACSVCGIEYEEQLEDD